MKDDEDNSESIIRASKILASSLLFGAMFVGGIYGEHMTMVNNRGGALLIYLSLIPLHELIAAWCNFSIIKWGNNFLRPRIQKFKKDLHDYYQEHSPNQNKSQQPTGDPETD